MKAPPKLGFYFGDRCNVAFADGSVRSLRKDLKNEIWHLLINRDDGLPLPADMLDLVANANELRMIAGDPLGGRLLFASKEAVYKAAFPLDRAFLEFPDISVDLGAGKAVTRGGREFALRSVVSSHIVVLALA